MTNLKDKIVLIQKGEILNTETLNKPVKSLADQVDIKFSELVMQEGLTPDEKTKLDGIADGATANRDDSLNADKDHSHTIEDVTGLQDSLNSKVEKETGKGLSDANFTQEEKDKLSGIVIDATKNRADSENADKVHSHTMSEVTGLGDALANKVDKMTGKQLSDTNFTQAEKDKLSSLESSKFIGLFVSESALPLSGSVGDYANVDGGTDNDVYRVIWDSSDNKWVKMQGASTELTDAQIKQQYESNPDTNAFTDDEKAKLSNVANGATVNRSDTLNADKVHSHTMAQVTGLNTALDNKVDKVAGHSLVADTEIAKLLIVEQIAQDAAEAAIAAEGDLVVDAPADGNIYSRKDNDWVLSAVSKEYLDVNLYWPNPAANIEPVSGVLARMYPRHNLSGAILPACFARREIASSTENLTLEITSTNPDKLWKATCVILAGERDGFFTSGSDMDVSSTEGFIIKPNPAPTGAVTGLSLSFRWEILADQSSQRLSVPQPGSVNTVIIYGTGAGPTLKLEKLSKGISMTSQDVGGNIRDSKDVAVSSSSEAMAFLRSDNKIVVADIRSGLTMSTLTSSNPRRGLSLNRSSTRFVTTELRGSDVWLMEYDYPSGTLAHEMQLVGVTSVNSVKYAPNDRFILIGHSSGLFLLNTLTYLPTTITSPPVGAVLDAIVSPTLYAIMCTQPTGVTLHVVNSGEPMAYTGSKTWSNITCSEFNWDKTADMPYPHFVVGGMNTLGDWEVIPYSAAASNYNEMSWKISFGEEIVGVAFSEANLSSGEPQDSIFGRALIVFGKTKYTVYSLTSGVEVATQPISGFTQITGGLWKEAKGVYV